MTPASKQAETSQPTSDATAARLDFFRRALAAPVRAVQALIQVTDPRRPFRALRRTLTRHGLVWLLRLSRPLLRVVATTRGGKVKRSLWAGTPILTLPVCARSEQLLGVQADSLVYFTYFITNEFTYNLSRWFRGPWWWNNIVLPYAVFVWACIRYQRFHFFCDRGLLPNEYQIAFNEHELALLSALGKEVYFYPYGADVRTRRKTEALGPHNCCTECPEPGNSCVCDDAEGARLQAILRRYATAIFSMGDMVHYTPGSRNDLFFWPIDLSAEKGQRYAPVYPDADASRPLRIVHAPNHRGFKGTHFLIEAVARMQTEGLPLDLVLVERVPNRQALEIYRTADVVFDQCLVGFHGYFALEAMAMGKPVMVFIRHPEQYLACAAECPFINTPAHQIETVLRRLVANRAQLAELGRRGRRYIEKYHDLGPFAARLGRFYQELRERGRRPATSLPHREHGRAAA